MNITVIGAGALGRLWLFHLARAGHFVHAMTKNKRISELKYPITDLSGQTNRFACLANDNEALKVSDVILITLKAYAIESMLADSMGKFPTNIPIIILHNGMGVHEKLEFNYPNTMHQFYYGVTTQAAYIKDSYAVHAANGETVIGQKLNRQSSDMPIIQYSMQRDIIPVLNQVLGPVTYSDNISALQWRKLAINALINPLTVKYQCKNGQLANYQDELFGLYQELAHLLTVLNIRDECGIKILDGLMENVLNVIKQTGNNYSSMYQDYLSKRPSEIDYITGYLLTKAKEVGINMPMHQSLYELVVSRMQYDGL